MFSWVTQQLETISQAVAPPPTDPPSLFVHCCSRGEEQAAMEAAYQFATTNVDHRPMSMVIVHAGKQQTALHVACQYGLSRVMDYLLSSSSSSNDTLHDIIHVRDALGNTPLHAAAAATGATVAEKDAIVGLVQRLVTELQASPVAKNYAQQTPYDVAVLDRVRQYLLPIQLQRETQDALDNGGVGLPPGVDLGGLRINYSNSTLGPPPMGMGGPPVMMPQPEQVQEQPPAPSVFDTPTAAHKSPAMTDVSGSMPPPPLSSSSQPTPVIPHQPVIGAAVDQPAFPAPPSSGGSSNNGEYATRGYSSAHIYNPKGKRVMKPDGFHSSSSDKRLQEKYGHAQAFPSSGHMPPPPPRSGHSPVVSGNGSGTSGDTSQASPSPAGPNPFAGGSSVFASGGARVGLQRYVPVDPMTGRPLPQPQQPSYAAVPAPASAPYSSPPTPATMFVPGAVATPGQFQQPAAAATFMPPSTAAATPSSAGLSTPSPGSGSFFPAPPKRSDAISPRAQSLSGFPSPPTAAASVSSPPRHAGAPNTGTTTATTSSSPFAAAPSLVSTTSGAASSFLSPPPAASKFPSPPSASAISKFPAPPVPSASASSLFASPPPPARGTSAPAASANVANTMDASSTPQFVPPVQEEPALKAVVAAPDMFSTPQPTMTLPQQSATALFSSPVQVAADESVAVVPVASSFEGDVGPGDSDAARGLLPQAPKSGESVKSAAELFGSPAGGFTDAIEPEAASLPTMVEMIVVNQAPKSGESIKSAADLFGAPTLDTSNAADAASHVPSKGTEHPVIFELVDDAACSASASVDFDPAAAISDEACGAIVLISENLEQDGQLPDTKVAQTRDAESPSKLLNDESEMLQEIPLSPSQDDE